MLYNLLVCCCNCMMHLHIFSPLNSSQHVNLVSLVICISYYYFSIYNLTCSHVCWGRGSRGYWLTCGAHTGQVASFSTGLIQRGKQAHSHSHPWTIYSCQLTFKRACVWTVGESQEGRHSMAPLPMLGLLLLLNQIKSNQNMCPVGKGFGKITTSVSLLIICFLALGLIDINLCSFLEITGFWFQRFIEV